MRKFIILSSVLTLSLLGCSERENPLLSYESTKLAKWVYSNKTPQITQCAKIWADLTNAQSNEIKKCESVASNLAKSLENGGFGQIKAQDVIFPTLWLSYNELIKASQFNSFDPQKAGNAMKLDDSGSLRKKLEEYKKQKKSGI